MGGGPTGAPQRFAPATGFALLLCVQVHMGTLNSQPTANLMLNGYRLSATILVVVTTSLAVPLVRGATSASSPAVMPTSKGCAASSCAFNF